MTLDWAGAQEQIGALVAAAPGQVAVVVRELPAGQELSIGGDDPFASASLIKVPVLVTALRQVETGQLALSERIRFDAGAAVGGSGILAHLSDVVDISVRDLLELMITISDNTATNLLIDRLTLPAIAHCIEQTGLPNTTLQRRMMDLQARGRGLDNRTSAADMASLMAAIADGATLFADPGSYRIAQQMLTRQQVNDRLPRFLPPGWVLAHKTGELDGVRHDAGFISIDGRPTAAIAVLTEGFGTDDQPDVYGRQAAELVAEIGRLAYSVLDDGSGR